ncbi:uncharacterized protein K452DRAFT_196345, partial [Aplosporella prunicola CBS 121167]
DFVLCGRVQGIQAGKLCDKCDGRCLSCDSFVSPSSKARVCNDCAYESEQQKCMICQHDGAANDAFFCRNCVLLEHDRDGCPRIIN